jgi:hypothetical protein
MLNILDFGFLDIQPVTACHNLTNDPDAAASGYQRCSIERCFQGPMVKTSGNRAFDMSNKFNPSIEV